MNPSTWTATCPPEQLKRFAADMGFTLQLLTNAGSRLIYMALLGLLNQRDAGGTTAHATLLANAHAVSALFTLNAFQYYIARQTVDGNRDLGPCRTQFVLIVAMLSVLLITALAWPAASGHDAPMLCSILIAALSLALPELIFTLATAHNKVWRPLTFYGTQSAFYVGYGLALWLDQSPAMAAISACLPSLLISLALFQSLRLDHVPSDWRSATKNLAATLKLRLSTLAASVPIIATPPAMAYFMGKSPETAWQIPQMLLFSSFAGALAFLMGNVFQHHGRDLMPILLRLQRDQRVKVVLTVLAGIFILSTTLAWPVEMILALLKSRLHQPWPGHWMLYAATCATAAVVLQWYTTVCMHHARPRPVMASNALYLMMAIALTSTTLSSSLHVFTILAICALVRSSLNVADFFLMGKLSWRT